MTDSRNRLKNPANRRSFLKKGLVVAGTASVGAGLFEDAQPLFGKKDDGKVSKGDAAILRFLAAAEILESD